MAQYVRCTTGVHLNVTPADGAVWSVEIPPEANIHWGPDNNFRWPVDQLPEGLLPHLLEDPNMELVEE